MIITDIYIKNFKYKTAKKFKNYKVVMDPNGRLFTVRTKLFYEAYIRLGYECLGEL